MTGTALGVNSGKSTRTITFKNEAHKKFYMEYLQKCRYQDVYHKALVYCLGLNSDTRDHVDRIYDFKEGYKYCLHGWLRYLKTGRKQYMDYLTEEIEEDSLISQIKEFYNK